MTTQKLHPGTLFQELSVYDQDDRLVDISKPTGGAEWQLIVVYRHRNCPKCTDYLNKLAGYRQRLLDIGVDIAAVSTDSKEQLQEHLTQVDVNFPIYYGLTLEQIQDLGLYVSVPLSPEENDREFSEPGLFLIDPDGLLLMVDISNAPFLRPDLDVLVSGIEWKLAQKTSRVARGTYR